MGQAVVVLSARLYVMVVFSKFKKSLSGLLLFGSVLTSLVYVGVAVSGSPSVSTNKLDGDLNLANSGVLLKESQLPFTIRYPVNWLKGELGLKVTGVNLLSGKRSPFTSVRLLFSELDGGKVNYGREFKAFEKLSTESGLRLKRLSSHVRIYGRAGHRVRGVEREYVIKKLIAKRNYSLRLKLWYGSDETNLYSFQLSDTPSRYAKANAIFTEMLGTVIFK